jgi:hypothetical protein
MKLNRIWSAWKALEAAYTIKLRRLPALNWRTVGSLCETAFVAAATPQRCGRG